MYCSSHFLFANKIYTVIYTWYVKDIKTFVFRKTGLLVGYKFTAVQDWKRLDVCIKHRLS